MMRARDIELLIGRILIAVFFLPSGIEKLLGWPGIVHVLIRDGAPLPLAGGIIVLICEIVVAGLILLGVQVRPLALILAIYTLAAAVIGHGFWALSPPASALAHSFFFKDLALAGGLLGLSAAGAGRLALWRNS
ncbi:MAG: DoxX family protein [Acetobacteraceae bacterium]